MNYLKIKNFGPVKDATIELKPFLVLIGGQGTGKSTIAKLLSIFQELFWYLDILKESEKVKQPFTYYGIDQYFSEGTKFDYQSETFHITYSEGKFSIENTTIKDKDQLIKRIQDLIVEEHHKMITQLGFSVNDDLSEFFKQNNKILRANRGTSFYIPAERNLAGTFSSSLANMIFAEVPIPKNLLYYLSYFEKAKKEHPNYNVPVLNLVYTSNESEEGIIIEESGNKKILSLGKCSSGIQSLLPMLMVYDYCSENNFYGTYVIEEPEQNLFPDNQLSVLRYIVGKRNLQHNSIIITTHSPYLLSGINISLMAGQVAQHKEYKDEVTNILLSEYHLAPDSVAAYALGDTDNYCKAIINPQTRTIDQNYLDTTSTVIGQEFSKLYKLYIKTLR